MIKYLALENFQSHISSTLNFHKGVNVITGPSDSGKSVLIKALYWLVNNRPSGESFKNLSSKKQDQMAVEIETDDHTIAIIRNEGKTSYIEGNNEYTAIRTDVPKEISKVLNLDDYNIQTQHQPYFLLQDTPGEIARKLNELVGLDIIDVLYKNIAAEIRDVNYQIGLKKNTISDIEEELEKFKNLDVIEKLIKSIEKNYQKTAETTSAVNFLEKSIESLESIDKDMVQLQILSKLEKKTKKVSDAYDDYLSVESKVSSIQSMIVSLEDIEKDLEEYTEWVKIEETINSILNDIKTNNTILCMFSKMKTVLTKIDNIEIQENKEMDLKEKTITQYLNLLEKENVCPISNLTFPKQCLANIKKVL